jgi:hypothetical protein
MNIGDLTQIMLILTKSTGNYVYKRILSEKEKAAYRTSMDQCLSILNEGFNNLSIMRTKIESLKEETLHLYVPTLFNNRKSEVVYHNLAIDQVIEIMFKLELRFLGGGDIEPRHLKNKSLFTYTNSDTFN